MKGFCDCHSHILPGMDDGCKTPEQSVEALRLSYAQGVRAIFATPHYYPVESVEAFLARRKAAWESLQAEIRRQGVTDIPQIVLGAEVAYRPGISSAEGIEKLCLGSADYLLLELPFRAWGKEELRQVSNFGSVRGIIPVLAHYERYRTLQSKEIYGQMARQDVLIQKNAESFSGFFGERRACREVKAGRCHLLGSDCHNLRSRKPNLPTAVESLQRRGLQKELDRITQIGWEIFSLANKESRG
jgi:protein-tyrosine phosphatase